MLVYHYQCYNLEGKKSLVAPNANAKAKRRCNTKLENFKLQGALWTLTCQAIYVQNPSPTLSYSLVFFIVILLFFWEHITKGCYSFRGTGDGCIPRVVGCSITPKVQKSYMGNLNGIIVYVKYNLHIVQQMQRMYFSVRPPVLLTFERVLDNAARTNKGIPSVGWRSVLKSSGERVCEYFNFYKSFFKSSVQ